MSERIFKHLKFLRSSERRDATQAARYEFLIPGVNSGIYKPATLHIIVVIKEKVAGFFRLKDMSAVGNITLTDEEFDQLYAEMEKIKKFRDAKIA
jgi:hypothetical protein